MFTIRLFLFICVLLPSALFGQVEICDNGIDDDNDGLIDINDNDCFCTVSASQSLIRNPSFEETDCCPDDRSQLYCATDWIQASSPTTDYLHECGWAGLDAYLPPTPFPDGQGVLGFRDGRIASTDSLDAYWKEYAGACLISPMVSDSVYRFQFDLGFVNPQISPPINVSFFGTASCEHLPFGIGDVAFGCPSNSPEWVKLGEIMVSGGAGDRWVKSFIEIQPQFDISAIAIGPDCPPIFNSGAIYYFFDNLLLASLSTFDLLVLESLHPCDDNFTLSVPDNEDLEYQWYLNGIAIAGETSAKMKNNHGEGSYQVRILSGIACRISSPYEYIIPRFDTSTYLAICEGESYAFGDSFLSSSGSYIDTLKTVENCDSIISLELKVIGEKYDTVATSIAPGNTFTIDNSTFSEEGEFTVTTTSSLGCDSLIFLKLSMYDVYIPDIFSPNNDGINDHFHPFGVPDEVVSYDMKIYDRWGTLIFQGTAWDGSNESTDVFVYKIEMDFINGESSTFLGSVTLLD